jgi:pimeloyl-ACP methyl ester carboxylesterase
MARSIGHAMRAVKLNLSSEENAMSNTITPAGNTATDPRSPVIALHCSGGSGKQWWHLSHALQRRFMVTAPDLIGCGENTHWRGEGPFHLSDEAAAVVRIIDACDTPVHLVGHSYGGAVALRVAVERPNRIASVSLYEPTAFHVLKAVGPDGWDALSEIRSVAMEITRGIATGDYRAAARRFVDYWNGASTWDGLKPEAQADLMHWVPKAALDFHALIEERMPLEAYRRLRVPMLLMRGEHSPIPVQLVVQKLAHVCKPQAVKVIAGAGHMGPFTHSEIVNRVILDHVLTVSTGTHAEDSRRAKPAQAA